MALTQIVSGMAAPALGPLTNPLATLGLSLVAGKWLQGWDLNLVPLTATATKEAVAAACTAPSWDISMGAIADGASILWSAVPTSVKIALGAGALAWGWRKWNREGNSAPPPPSCKQQVVVYVQCPCLEERSRKCDNQRNE